MYPPSSKIYKNVQFASSATALQKPDSNIKFPKTKDPLATCRKKWSELRVVLSESTTITTEELKVGFGKMIKPERKKWLSDIESGSFSIIRSDN
jgi:ligand-binding SRPBCC domain-containing protein